ncbi:hypothetical protein AB6C47_018220 [Vibrio cyclitrophicus]
MWKKILLIMPLLFLQGCDDEAGINEPTDKGCYDSFQDLTYDTDMLFNACKSKDIYAEMNNVYKYRTEHEMIQEPLFESNKYITEEKAQALNANQMRHFEYDNLALKLKNDFFEISFNSGLLLLSIAIGIVFFGLSNRSYKFKSVASVSVNLLIIFSISNFLLNSNEIERNVNAAVMKTGNFIFRVYSTATLEEHKTNELQLQYSAKPEAYSDITALYNLNICLNNNRKHEMFEYEMAGNTWGSIDDYLTEYADKNKVVYPQKENGRGAIKIMTNTIGNYETVGYVRFKNCGTLSFTIKKYDNGFSDLLNRMQLKQLVGLAVETNDIESGWNSIHRLFEEKFPVQTDESRSKLTTLLITYLHEYKKKLLLDKITKDYLNADKFYQNINKATCIHNSKLSLLSNDSLDLMLSGDSNYLNNNECLILSDTTISKAQEKVLHEISDKEDIKFETDILKRDSQELVEKEYQNLAEQYQKISEFYTAKIKEIHDVDELLIELLNEGWSSAGKLQRVNSTDTAYYKELFKELQYITDFDYSNIYPYYSHRDKLRVDNKDLYTYDFVEQFFPQETSFDKNNLLVNNIATTKIKNRYNNDLSVSSQNDVEIDRSLKEMIGDIGKAAEKISCANAQTVEDCLVMMEDFDGIATWDAISRDLLTTGSQTYVWGLATDVGGITITAFADYVLGARKVASAKRKKGKKLDIGTSDVGKLLASWAGKTVSFVGQSAQWIGGLAMLVGSLMQLLLMFVEFVNQYTIIMITMTTNLLPFTMIATVLGLVVSVSSEHYKQIVVKLFRLMISAVVMTVFSLVKIFTIWIFISSILWSLPYINATVTYSLSSWLPDYFQYLIRLIGLCISLPIIFYTTYLGAKKVNQFLSSIENKIDMDGIAGGAVESVELVVKGVMAKGVLGIGKRAEIRRGRESAKRLREMSNNKEGIKK